jgi:hypothetical protein
VPAGVDVTSFLGYRPLALNIERRPGKRLMTCGGYRSITSRGLNAREQQGRNWSLAARSSSVRYWSR